MELTPDNLIEALNAQNQENEQLIAQLRSQAQTSTPPFGNNEAHFRDKYLLRTSEYKDYLNGILAPYVKSKDAAGREVWMINKSVRLSKACREALLSIVNGYFDSTIILSNNTESKVSTFFGQSNKELIRRLKFKVQLIMARLNYNALDAANPDLQTIEGMIEEVFEYELTRTSGEKREGILQHPHVSSETQIERIQAPPTPRPDLPQQKKGIFG